MSTRGGTRRDVPRRVTAAALAVLSVAPVGCYRYVPATAGELPPEAVARLELSLDGTQALAGTLGPNVKSVFGRVERQAGDTVVVALQETTTLSGQVFTSSGASVGIPRGFVTGVQLRERSRGRTAVAIAGGVAAMVFVAVVAKARGEQGTTSTPPPPPPP